MAAHRGGEGCEQTDRLFMGFCWMLSTTSAPPALLLAWISAQSQGCAAGNGASTRALISPSRSVPCFLPRACFNLSQLAQQLRFYNEASGPGGTRADSHTRPAQLPTLTCGRRRDGNYSSVPAPSPNPGPPQAPTCCPWQGHPARAQTLLPGCQPDVTMLGLGWAAPCHYGLGCMSLRPKLLHPREMGTLAAGTGHHQHRSSAKGGPCQHTRYL